MIHSTYTDLLAEIKQKINEAQVKVVVAANAQLLWLYWQLGTYILDNQKAQGWGTKIIERLSKDLKNEYPQIKGFSVRNLKYMRSFAEAYPVHVLLTMYEVETDIRKDISIVQQVVALLENKATETVQPLIILSSEEAFFRSSVSRVSWSHHIVLLDKVKSPGQRFWYMLNTIEHGISRNTLAMQIESSLFDRQVTAKKVSNFERTLPKPQTDFANYLMKDPYIFDFVQAKEKADERNIEEQLAANITKFLLELGQGFAFIGRQVHFEIGDTDFYADLLFYHTQLHAYVVVELKARPFEPGDAGQLNFYVNVVNDKLKTGNDNNTIGLLLCKGKNKVVAEYSLKGYTQPLGISDYQISKAIPEELKSKLPDIAELEDQLEKESDN